MRYDYITLYNAKQFTVDSHGAYVTKLTDSEGGQIVFERRIYNELLLKG